MAGIALLLQDQAQIDMFLSLGEALGLFFAAAECCPDAEADALVRDAASRGVSALIGTEACLAQAQRCDLFCLVYDGCEGSARALLTAAMRYEMLDTVARCTAAEIASITRASFCGILRVDDQGNVIYANDRARKLLDSPEHPLIGCYLPNLFNSMDKLFLDEVITNGEPVYSLITGTQAQKLFLNIDPVFINDRIDGAVVTVTRAAGSPHRVRGAAGAEDEIQRRLDNCSYSSREFAALLKSALAAAFSDAPVLITGEEGTEAPELARFIHSKSARHGGRFVELDCSALDRSLPELLPRGLMGGATLFLSHVERLDAADQHCVDHLLRGRPLLEDADGAPPDVRVIASTGENLRALVKSGAFREDLYYALTVVTLHIPPLRARPGNIDEYVERFIQKYSEQYTRNVILDSDARRCLRSYAWPGNVPEVEGLCQRLVLASRHRKISGEQVRRELEQMEPQPERVFSAGIPAATEAENILAALQRFGGNRAAAARELGISKTTLWRRINQYGITNEFKFRKPE